MVTDADGRFRIGGLAPGRHQVQASIVGGLTPSVPVVLDAGRESPEVVLRLEDRAFVVDGRVVEGGRPVPGARVFAMAGARRVSGGLPADGEGHFTLRLAEPGTISFVLDTHDVIAPASLVVSGPHTAVVVEVASRSTIRGEVRLRGQPVPGAEVSVGGPAVDGMRRTTSDGAGRFELGGLPAGHYGLYGQSYAVQAFSSVEHPLDLPAHTTLDGIVLELDGAASIAGTVVDQDGAPVAQVAVKYTHTTTGDLCRATTGARGEFVCPMLSGSGDYTPLVRLDESSAIALPAAAPDGLETQHLADGDTRITGVVLRVRLVQATLRGRVVDGTGAPYPDVTVRAIEASTGYTPATAPWVGTRRAITDVDGRFTLPAWGDATYTVHARAPDGAEAAVAGVVPGGAEVVLRVERPGRIVGTLVGFHGRPAMAVRRLGNTIELATPAIDGDRFVIDGLSAGRYGVMAIAGAEGGAELVEVAAGTDATVTVRARPTTRLTGRVIDLVSGAAVGGVRCTVAPFIDDAGVAWFGTDAPPTDADGRFELDAPSGAIEVSCRPNPARHSDGAARVLAAAGGRTILTIPVVVSPTSEGASNGLGLRIGFAHAPVTGHILTIVELRPGGSAARAGLRVGDVIIAVDGRDVTGLTDGGLARLLGLHAVGDTAQVTRLRAGVRAVVAVTVEPPWWR